MSSGFSLDIRRSADRRRADPSDHQPFLDPHFRAATTGTPVRVLSTPNPYNNVEIMRQQSADREDKEDDSITGRPWLDVLGGALLGLGIIVAAVDVTWEVKSEVLGELPRGWPSSDHGAPSYPLDANLRALLPATQQPAHSKPETAGPDIAASLPPLPEPKSAPPEAPRPFTHNTIADAAARAGPAVVNISSIGKWGLLTVQNEGSGFIIAPDGTILTNAHVVISNPSQKSSNEKAAAKLLVTLEDGRTCDGEVLCYDTLSDIALVRVNTPTPLPTVKLGQSATLRPGDWVLALGSPHNLPHTVTAGIISCVDRSSTEMGLTGNQTDYLQTDAAVNQGNSGGPLVNLDGEVIGINTLKLKGTDGVSFAIPIDAAVRVVGQLLKYGHVRQPFLGIRMYELNEETRQEMMRRRRQNGGGGGGGMGLSSSSSSGVGVFIAQVIPGSPAARGGLMVGDVIFEFGGVEITKVKQILEILGDHIGVEMNLKVHRNGKEVTLVVTPEEAMPVK